ncbi:hypothetical protein QS930_24625 [Escherichia coli]|nr:hypothetical protein [Escherichia coli]
MKTIDMSLLPPPAFVKTPLFSDVKSNLLSELQILYPQFNALLESDPAVKLLEIVAYREIIITARVNQGMLAVLLAFAKGSDLDQIGANFDCLRLLITPANPDVIPPTEAVYVKWFTEFGHLNRGDMLTSEQHRCHNEKKKFQRRV